ncbi:MAG: DUF504 domain-containing protein [Calothrix sp. C42_A2020_038]|nr:DUF504 domain-containing protein [Calothrix sp. C42_A2020_038]
MEKQRMAPINEIYNRIIWDERLNSRAFIAGFQERMSSDGMREKPLAQWAIDGDIPWHRIRYIRCGDVIVWDREKHLDLISTGQLPAIAWKNNITELETNSLEAPIFNSKPIYQYDTQGWISNGQELKDINIKNLSVATFNVLFNLYETEKIQTEKRLPAIFEQLHQCEADIIAIQEATPQFVESLLLQNWIRSYFISESNIGDTVKPYGNLLISRFPFKLVEHKFFGAKHVLVGTWQINGRLLHIAVVHLTSNRAENAVEKRAHQLSTLLTYLKNQLQNQPGDSLIVGDFNTRGNEQEEILISAGFVDVWQQLRPYEPGYTFDPNRNPLAALLSLSGKAGRLDRILLQKNKAIPSRYIPVLIDLFACNPIKDTQETLYPSDHFGLRAVFEVDTTIEAPVNQDKINLTTIRPVYQSAIVIIPPDDVLPVIQAIRQKYDARFERWMPHINLIYGFLPESYFDQAQKIISEALSKLKPFTVTLTEFGTFTHRKSCTAWLRPVAEPETALHELQTVLQNLFPQCDEQSKKSSIGFTPHLSVGQFPNLETAHSILPQWRQVRFTVDSVALISRRGDKPFEIKHVVRLGNNCRDVTCNVSTTTSELQQIVNQLQPELTQAQQLQRQIIVDIIKQACAECLGSEPTLHLLGSARLGVQTPQSDIDIVCMIPAYLSGEAFLHSVQQNLQGLYEYSQVVLDARVPVLRLKIETISIDLLYARYENTISAIERRIDSISLKAIIGCWETDLIIDTVSKYVSFDLFKTLLRAVRAWAKSRSIYGNAWGFLGGFSWVILTAWSCIYYNQADKSIESLLAHFFQVLNQHNWKQPISLTEAGKKYDVQLPRDWLPITTSIEPCQNTARNITRSTAHILQAEFKRGAELTELAKACKISWGYLFEPVNLQEEFDTCLEIKITNSNQELEKDCGTLEGYIVGLIIQLEQLDIFVRPSTKLEKIQDGAKLTLGLHLPSSCNIKIVELAINFISQLKIKANIHVKTS